MLFRGPHKCNMMKTKQYFFLIIIIIAISISGKSQTFISNENVIFHSDLVVPAAISAADMDGDGDIDIIAALENQIFWYENIGGESIFNPLQVIKTLSFNVGSLHTADLNGDGFADIIVTAYNKILFYENKGEKGVFAPGHEICSLPGNLKSLYLSDLDGDGRVDILAAFDYNIFWLRNFGDDLGFSQQFGIDTLFCEVQFIYAADLDEDGDLDVISAMRDDNEVAWYENVDGLGTFQRKSVITASADFVQFIYAADLNNNGNLDILIASAYDNKIAWYENKDGQGTFGDERIISRLADYPQYVHAADLDGDGDMDVFSASFHDDKVAWYENLDGQGSFRREQIISTTADQAGFVNAIDLDGDGDLDIITASCDFKISWHRNTLPLKILREPKSKFVFPGSIINLEVVANEYATFFQWQINTENGFIDLVESDIYTGCNTSELHIQEFTTDMLGSVFRCIISGTNDAFYTNEVTLLLPPGDQVLEADDNCQAILPDYTSQLDYTQNPAPSSMVVGITKVMLNSKDTSDFQEGFFYVEVVDSISPRFLNIPPEDQTIKVDAYGDAYLPNYLKMGVEVIDNCSRSSQITTIQSPPSYTSLSEEVTEVLLSAFDIAGNRTEESFQVFLVDYVNPRITCVEDQIFEIEKDQATYIVSGTILDPVSVRDNYKIESVLNNYNGLSSLNGVGFSLGLTNVVWTVSDAGGNQAQCSFNVEVIESTEIEKLKKSGILVYPNPAEGKFYYEFTSSEFLYLRVSDTSGKILIDKPIKTNVGVIDLSAFPDGIYHCSIETLEDRYLIELVKE
jgi:hypothetical protein